MNHDIVKTVGISVHCMHLGVEKPAAFRRLPRRHALPMGRSAGESDD